MKHLNYLKYVIRHKWFVLLAGIQVGAPLWRLLIHDWSKFLPCEWFPYATFFYGLPKDGDTVEIDSFEGFGGQAVVIESRYDKFSRYKVRINHGYIGESQEFWAHDFEVGGLDEAKEAFDVAWNHHQKANPHHWQYWLLTFDSGETVALQMPPHFALEMIADWMGAGRAITGDGSMKRTLSWYEKNKDRIILHPRTRESVEDMLHERHFVGMMT